jgi:hypothetical protein
MARIVRTLAPKRRHHQSTAFNLFCLADRCDGQPGPRRGKPLLRQSNQPCAYSQDFAPSGAQPCPSKSLIRSRLSFPLGRISQSSTCGRARRLPEAHMRASKDATLMQAHLVRAGPFSMSPLQL